MLLSTPSGSLYFDPFLPSAKASQHCECPSALLFLIVLEAWARSTLHRWALRMKPPSTLPGDRGLLP